MRVAFVSLIFVFFLSLAPVRASEPLLSGYDLKAKCASWQLGEENFCIGYITAAFDAFVGLSQAGKIRGAVCVPPGTTAHEVQSVVKAWLNTSSFDLQFSGAFVVYKALKSFYPCTKK